MGAWWEALPCPGPMARLLCYLSIPIDLPLDYNSYITCYMLQERNGRAVSWKATGSTRLTFLPKFFGFLL